MTRVFKPVKCIECGQSFERHSSNQIRCPLCQEFYTKDLRIMYQRLKRIRRKNKIEYQETKSEYLKLLERAVNL